MLSMKNDKTAMNLRKIMPTLCRQIRPVSTGIEIGPGEAIRIESGTLSSTMFPDLIVVAGSFEIDEISLEVNNARRRIVFSSRDLGDRTDNAPFVDWSGALTSKILRATEDALNKLVMDDDSRIAETMMRKIYALPGQEGAWIKIEQLEDKP